MSSIRRRNKNENKCTYGGGKPLQNKAFTLIELLAVIVILAIIALIATPIILNIINGARKSSEERSIDLYGRAVEQAVARYQLNNSKKAEGTFTPSNNGKELTQTNPEDSENPIRITVDYSGEKVYCPDITINEKGKVTMRGCKVNDADVNYVYGGDNSNTGNNQNQESVYEQRYIPRYYWYVLYGFGNIGDDLPSSAKTSVSKLQNGPYQYNEDISFYMGFDVDSNNKITEGYSCFAKEGKEYCLKRTSDGSAYETNIGILREAFSGDDPGCSAEPATGWNGSATYFECRSGDFGAYADSHGSVSAYDRDSTVECYMSSDDNFQCETW